MREGELKRSVVYLAVVIGGVLIAAAIIALYTPWWGLFTLREIAVEGNNRLAKDEIVRTSGLRLGRSLPRMPVRCAAEEISKLPWVQEVAVRRVYPHKVEIIVRERSPIAVIADPNDEARQLIVGEGGVLVQQAGVNESVSLMVRGADLTGSEPGSMLTDHGIIAALEHLHRSALTAGPFHRADFSDPDAIMLHTPEGLEVNLGPIDGIQMRIDALAGLLQTLNYADYRSIDLRFGGEAILVPRKVVNR